MSKSVSVWDIAKAYSYFRILMLLHYHSCHSLSNVNFLDTTIYFKYHGLLESKLYVKPHDICTLLHNDSFHSESCKKGIIYSQALRYIFSNNEKLTEELNKLRDNLLRRGYNLSNMQSQFSKAIQHTQHEFSLVYID